MVNAVDRPATSAEVAVVRWLIDNAPVGDIAAYREQTLDSLRVMGVCDCGCASLHFEPLRGSTTMIADAFVKYPDGARANLILWGREGKIAWLEINDYPDGSHRTPAAEDLLRWEQMYE
jgi:hypothetical protein